MTLLAYCALLAAVALQRLAELWHSQRNSERARAAGALEAGEGHYPWMVALHTTFLIACALEVWLLDRPLIPLLAAGSFMLLLAATALRYAAIKALGERWTTRVFAWPERDLVQEGPYRFIRHPNYLAVVVEIAALPLVHSAWVTAVAFSLLNGWLLAVRIRVENDVLGYGMSGGDDRLIGPGESRR